MIVERKPQVFCNVCSRQIKQTEKFCRMCLYRNCSVWNDAEIILGGQYPATDDTYDLCNDCLSLLDKTLSEHTIEMIRRIKDEGLKRPALDEKEE